MLLLVTLSCKSLEEDTFRTELATASCATYERCSVLWLWDDDLAACEEDAFALDGVAGETCDAYDPEAAQTCLDDWVGWSCDSVFAGETPESCAAVCADQAAAEDTGA